MLAEEATNMRDIDTVDAESRVSELKQKLDTAAEQDAKEIRHQLAIAERLVAASKQIISK